MSDEVHFPDEALARIDTLVAAIDRAEAAGIEYTDSVSIHFLRNFTVEPLEPYLKFHVLREAIKPEISFGGYDTVLQELLDEESALRGESPDIVVVALDLSMLDQEYGRPGWCADRAIDRLREMFEAVREHTSSLIVANTMISPVLSQEGITTPGDAVTQEVARINAWVCEYASSDPGRFVVADWERLLLEAGQDNALDQRFWRASLAPFKAVFLDLYAREIAKVIRALKGKAKKCLVLDCDDTLWGGVIGEDGLDGIRLGTDEWPGEAYCAFQHGVLALQERGVLIVICSKNNEEDVWEVMRDHPNCVLKQSHLAAWRINWEDKASNIKALSDELNLALDSFVFVDDSPRECQLVREFLPQVTVLQVPDDLHDYPDLILKDGLFDTLSISDEDRHRAVLYREENDRSKDRAVHVDLHDYLASLQQVLRIWEAGDEDRARVTQLTQKTNQFNLTTKRYSEGQIEELMKSDQAAVFAMSVSDRYGDLGTTGVLIARHSEGAGQIDSLLLSCRILGRKLEIAFVDKCLQYLEERWGISSWRASYKPTKKNAQVADFWDRVGFSAESGTDSIKTYRMAAGQRTDAYRDVMSIEEAGIDAGSN